MGRSGQSANLALSRLVYSKACAGECIEQGPMMTRMWSSCLARMCAAVGNKVRRDKTAIKSHTFCDFNFILDGTTCNNTFLANFLHSLSNEVANVSITIGRDGGQLGLFQWWW